MGGRRVGAVALVVLATSLTTVVGVEPASAVVTPTLKWTRSIPAKVVESSPTAADLDGNGTKEVLFGAHDGNLYGLRASDGGDHAGWPRQLGVPIDATPAIADVNRDNVPEVFVGTGISTDRDGDFFSLRNDGSERWKFHPSDGDFPSLSMFSSPTIGDVTGDNDVEVSGFSLGLLGWSFDADTGAVKDGWPFYQDDTTFSSPALFDVDGDGTSEYIVGGDSSIGGPVDHDGGMVRAIRGNGELIWEYRVDNEIIRSSPAIGDIDGDGEPEIVVGTGDAKYLNPNENTRSIFVLRRDGTLKWRRDLGEATPGSPALADVNGDGKLDVIQGTFGRGENKRFWVFNGDGSANPLFDPGDADGVQILGQPSTADIDADGGQDIVIATGSGVTAFSGKTGAQLFALQTGVASYQNAPLINDVDNNGRLDIVIAGTKPDNTAIVSRYEMPPSSVMGSLAWPQFRKDNRHTGSWLNPPLFIDLCAPAPGEGYRFVASDGGVFSYCDAPFRGSMGGQPLNRPVVGMASTADDNGYWLVASDGGMFAFGAPFFGSMGGKPLAQPIVGMAPAPGGNGYWLVASDGGIFAFGAGARFHGSMGGQRLNEPIVGMAATADGGGYWLVARDGGVFAFGNAQSKGSMGGQRLNAPVVGIAPTASGQGYWLVGSDGGIYAFNAPFLGSTGNLKLNQPVVGMSRADNGAYRMVASDGGVFSFGGAPFLGSTGSRRLNQPVVGFAS